MPRQLAHERRADPAACRCSGTTTSAASQGWRSGRVSLSVWTRLTVPAGLPFYEGQEFRKAGHTGRVARLVAGGSRTSRPSRPGFPFQNSS